MRACHITGNNTQPRAGASCTTWSPTTGELPQLALHRQRELRAKRTATGLFLRVLPRRWSITDAARPRSATRAEPTCGSAAKSRMSKPTRPANATSLRPAAWSVKTCIWAAKLAHSRHPGQSWQEGPEAARPPRTLHLRLRPSPPRAGRREAPPPPSPGPLEPARSEHRRLRRRAGSGCRRTEEWRPQGTRRRSGPGARRLRARTQPGCV